MTVATFFIGDYTVCLSKFGFSMGRWAILSIDNIQKKNKFYYQIIIEKGIFQRLAEDEANDK